MAPANLRPQPDRSRRRLQRPVEHRAGLADRRADLLVVLDQPRQADQRLRDALLQHHEGEQAADHVAGASFIARCRRRPAWCRATMKRSIG